MKAIPHSRLGFLVVRGIEHLARPGRRQVAGLAEVHLLLPLAHRTLRVNYARRGLHPALMAPLLDLVLARFVLVRQHSCLLLGAATPLRAEVGERDVDVPLGVYVVLEEPWRI